MVATENYCKWNKNILVSKPLFSGMTAYSMHIKTTPVTSQNYRLPPPLVTIRHKSGDPLPPLGCDGIYGGPLSQLLPTGPRTTPTNLHKRTLSIETAYADLAGDPQYF